MHNQGIEVLVNLLKDERDSTKAYACTSLTNMATDEIIREEVSQFQFTQSILPALNSPLVLFFKINFLNKSNFNFIHLKIEIRLLKRKRA